VFDAESDMRGDEKEKSEIYEKDVCGMSYKTFKVRILMMTL
jgi:hypothetical protein